MSSVTELSELQSPLLMKWLPAAGEKLNVVLMCVVPLTVPYWDLLSTQEILWGSVFEDVSISGIEFMAEDVSVKLLLIPSKS
jgi:hypothetical protein